MPKHVGHDVKKATSDVTYVPPIKKGKDEKKSKSLTIKYEK
jgi:hypothetical protein